MIQRWNMHSTSGVGSPEAPALALASFAYGVVDSCPFRRPQFECRSDAALEGNPDRPEPIIQVYAIEAGTRSPLPIASMLGAGDMAIVAGLTILV